MAKERRKARKMKVGISTKSRGFKSTVFLIRIGEAGDKDASAVFLYGDEFEDLMFKFQMMKDIYGGKAI